MTDFHNWTGDEEIDKQVPQFLNEDNAATKERLDTKFNKSLDIANASDLNNFIDEGFYCCNTNSCAETILNCPTNYAFGLMVWGKGTIVYQEVREYNGNSKNQDYNKCWRRSYYSSGDVQNAWSNWQKMAYTATTLDGYGITDGMSKDSQNSVSTMNIIGRDVNTSYLRLSGGDGIENSACLQLCGNAYSKGAGKFRLLAADSEHSAYLLGSPSGLLKWNDKNIVRSVNNSAADDNGNVTIDVNNAIVDTELSGTSTNPVQNKTIKAELDKKMAKTDKIYEANLEWGNSDLLDSFSPVDAAMVPELGSDHFCFFPPSNVDIEYSIDGGKTWLDYGLTIDQKWKLFSQEADYVIGKCTSNNQSTDNLLRITMRAAGVIYTQIKKFIFYISTNGSHQSYVTIETQKDGSDFKAYGGKHYLQGWSGYSVVNFEIIREQSVAGNDFRFGTTRYCNADTIRFTFGHEGFVGNNHHKGLTVKRIMAFGGTCWTAPSNMATNGHLYSYNYMKESLFPATVTAPNFIGKVNGKTIEASVPANAKFTDTVYTHPSTHPASMITGLSTVATSGSYNDLTDKPNIPASATVDSELSSTSVNPVQNRVIYNALLNKVGTDIFSGVALMGATSTIAWRQGAQPIGSIDATNYTGTAARATQDGEGNVITETYAKKGTANTWGKTQTFEKAICKEVTIAKEIYGVSYTDGGAITLATNVVHHVANSEVTLDMAQAITDFLSVDATSTVFSIYITTLDDSAACPLIITNAGTLKYVGSASDLAITGAGMLLNIMMLKDSSGNITSIVQASKLEGGA